MAVDADTREMRAKAKCCKDKPRCKTCPVVLKRLEQAGLAERLTKRTYAVDAGLRKSDIKPFRKR